MFRIISIYIRKVYQKKKNQRIFKVVKTKTW